MRKRLFRIVRVIGEGALAGLVPGVLEGAREVIVNEDVAHGMGWLAAERLSVSLQQWMVWGIAFSFGLALLAAVWGRPEARARRICFFLLALAGALAVAGVITGGAAFSSPLRTMHRPPSGAFLAVLAVSGGWLLMLRLMEMRRGRDSSPAGPAREGNSGIRKSIRPARRILRTLRTVTAGGGIAAGALVAILGFSLPRLGAARATGQRSVILISLDTLRADRVGVLGGSRRLTPRIDALGGEGVVFEEATSAAPWTLPSHVSLFTSRLSMGHGVRTQNDRIHPSRILLAERFRQAGYRTAAFTGGGFVSASFGFGQGFEIYREYDESFGRSSEPIFADGLDWIRRVRGAPFFLFLHTYAVHAPFTHGEFANPAEAGRLPGVFRLGWMRKQGLRGGDLTPAERHFVRDLYDGDVAYADGLVGKLIQGVEAAGLTNQVLWVVTSDHGEDLWDHDEEKSPTHGDSLYQELLHVPLVLRAPGLIPSGARVSTPVSLIDVAPTLLELTGQPRDPESRGISLRRTWAPGSHPEIRTVFSEGAEEGPWKMAGREGREKVILTLSPGEGGEADVPPRPLSIEIFDLRSDPGELHNLYSGEPESSSEILHDLLSRARSVPRRPPLDHPDLETLPENLLEKLRALGYLN